MKLHLHLDEDFKNGVMYKVIRIQRIKKTLRLKQLHKSVEEHDPFGDL